MTRASRLAPIVLLGLATCTVDPNKIKPTVEDLCREVVSVLGERVAQCEGVAVAWAQWEFSSDLTCARWGESVSAGRMGYDESAGVQCIRDLQSMSCDQLFASNGPPGACAQAIWGLVPAGSACSTSEECASGTYCNSPSGCGGTCRAYVSLGQVCYDSSISGSYVSCSQGLNCMPDPAPATTSRCQAPILAGYGCPNGYGCADGLYCDKSTGVPATYTCKADPTSGQACGNGLICADGLYCYRNSSTPLIDKTCQPKMTSGACGQYEACLTPLYVCAGPSSLSWTSTGNCQAIAREGQTCQNGYGECVRGAYCKTASAIPTTGDPGVCTVFPGPPAACGIYGGEWVWCLASYCTAPNSTSTGTCAAFVPLGQPCSSGGTDNPCGPGAYCNTSVSPAVCAVRCP